ncbi:hypothetical protein BGZ46_006698, partial [Entomortierella lignicola]
VLSADLNNVAADNGHGHKVIQDDAPAPDYPDQENIPDYPSLEDIPIPDYLTPAQFVAHNSTTLSSSSSSPSSTSSSNILVSSSSSSPSSPSTLSHISGPSQSTVVPTPHKSREHSPQLMTPEIRERAFDTQDISDQEFQDLKARLNKILSQTFSLHESPDPRLFIILPKDASDWDPADLYENKLQLFYLCDCGEHTRLATTTSTSSTTHNPHSFQKMEHSLHLVAHEGYELDNSYGFLKQYGVYVLSLLQMFRYGVEVAGYEVPSLENLAKETQVANSSALSEGIEVALFRAIEFVKDVLQHAGYTLSRPDQGSHINDSMSSFKDQGLKEISTFIKKEDEAIVSSAYFFAGLYRIVTLEGSVKWICEGHYEPIARPLASSGFTQAITYTLGSYDVRTGSANISISNSTQRIFLYPELEKTQSVIELSVNLTWTLSQKDIREFVDVIEKNTSILSISIVCYKVGQKTSFLGLSKRQDALLQLLTIGRLRKFELGESEGFLARISAGLWFSQIRCLNLLGYADWDEKYSSLLPILFRNCPKLTELGLNCKDLGSAFIPIQQTLETLDTNQQYQFKKLTLSTAHQESVQIYYDHGRPVAMDLDQLLNHVPEFAMTHEVIRNITFKGMIYSEAGTGNHTLLLRLLETQPYLMDIKLNCLPQKFRAAHEFIRDNSLRLREKFTPIRTFVLMFQDNTLTISNLQDPASMVLDLVDYFSLQPTAVGTLLRDYGCAMLKWDIHNNPMYTYPTIPISGIHEQLQENLEEDGGSDLKLEKLNITASNLEPNELFRLSSVFMNKCPRLNDFCITFKDNYRIDVIHQYAWAEWIATVSPKITGFVVYRDIIREVRLLERTCLIDFPKLKKFWLISPTMRILESTTLFYLWMQLQSFSAAPGASNTKPRYSMIDLENPTALMTGAPQFSARPAGSLKTSFIFGPLGSPCSPSELAPQFRLWPGPKQSPDLTSIRLENVGLCIQHWLKLLDVIDLVALEDFSLKGSNITDQVVNVIRDRLIPGSNCVADAATKSYYGSSVGTSSRAAETTEDREKFAKLKLLNIQLCNQISYALRTEFPPWVKKHLEGCTLIL